LLKRGPRIDQSVVVMTGASSGIGRSAAQRFAEQGAGLVLAARSDSDLEEAARECRRSGAKAITVPADVGSEPDVQGIAQAALERFGRFDVWVNNAGVIAYGQFEDMPSEVFDRVIQTNLLGQVYGARAALAQFRRQGSGVLINLSSVWGRVTAPNVIPYVVSKHGIRAFSECLRQGLATKDGAERIHVCTVLPESVDTPIFQHAANYTGREAKPVPPVIDVERTAKAIVGCVRRPRGEVTVGQMGHAVAIAAGIVPRQLYERVAPSLFGRTALDGDQTQNPRGNVFEPEPEWNRVDGGWRRSDGRRARRVLAGAAALGTSAAAAGLAAHRVRHKS